MNDPTSLDSLISAELSAKPRVLLVSLLTFDLVMTGLITILAITEPVPTRTLLAFLAMIALGLCWAVFFINALTTRRVLFAKHRVQAATISLLGASLFAAFAIPLAARSSALVGATTSLFAATLLMIAVVHLRSARRRYDALLARRDALERGVEHV